MITDRVLSADDVLDIKASDLPMLVFADNMRSLISWGIKARKKGFYNHVMIMSSPKWFLSQDFPFFRQVDAENYLQGKHRLKFINCSQWSRRKKMKVRLDSIADAHAPLLKRRYDVLGLFGQLVGIPGINVPWLNYCSERTASYLRTLDSQYESKHPCPKEMNEWTKSQQHRSYYCYGRYFPD